MFSTPDPSNRLATPSNGCFFCWVKSPHSKCNNDLRDFQENKPNNNFDENELEENDEKVNKLFNYYKKLGLSTADNINNIADIIGLDKEELSTLGQEEGSLKQEWGT